MKTAKGGRKHRSAVSFCHDSSFAAPRGGARCKSARRLRCQPDFTPRAPHGARRARAPHRAWGLPISILAPRVGRDRLRPDGQGQTAISIHAPRTGRDQRGTAEGGKGRQFQSARPARGATLMINAYRQEQQFQSARPARGATWSPIGAAASRVDFNPRAPHGARRPACPRILAP